MRNLIVFLTALILMVSIPAATAAITVDGNNSTGEWDANWSFGQTQATTYSQLGPFGDRLVIKQGGFGFSNGFHDEDPKNDSGTLFLESMATAGESSGYDLKRIYAHYDLVNDTLFGMSEVYGLPGDLDGDGDIAENNVTNGDSAGDPGPAGTGIGIDETWEIKISQTGASPSTILINNNNWTVLNGIPYGDVQTMLDPTAANPVYEIAIKNASEHFNLSLCADPIMIEVKAGGNRDVPGEDTATAFVNIPCPDIEIVKYVQDMNGVWHDANTQVTGPFLDSNSTVNWRYDITNTGNETLLIVEVIDDKLGLIDCPKDILNASETMTCFANDTVPNPCEKYRNVANVTAIGLASLAPVSDEDPAHYNCTPPVPSVTIVGLMGLIGILGLIGISGMRRRK